MSPASYTNARQSKTRQRQGKACQTKPTVVNYCKTGQAYTSQNRAKPNRNQPSQESCKQSPFYTIEHSGSLRQLQQLPQELLDGHGNRSFRHSDEQRHQNRQVHTRQQKNVRGSNSEVQDLNTNNSVAYPQASPITSNRQRCPTSQQSD